MKIGVPDEILHGDVDSYTPDWAPSLEERFHNTVKVCVFGVNVEPRDHAVPYTCAR